MSRYLESLRRTSLVVGALTLGWSATLHAQAADAAAQRVAMACTQGSDVAGCKSAAASNERHAVHAQRASTHAKAPLQREQAAHTVTALANDGSRFRYDSCGCSND